MAVRFPGARWAPLLAVLAVQGAFAEQVPVRVFTVADGLASNAAQRLLQDSRGFLWIGTAEGLSRFDGREFRTFSLADGLPGAAIEALAESPAGDLWIGTNAGLCRLREDARSGALFEVLHPGTTPASDTVTDLEFGADGALWVATADGLYRAAPPPAATRFERVDIPVARLRSGTQPVNALLRAADGTLWGGAWQVAFALDPAGPVRTVVRTPWESDSVNDLAQDAAGTVWLATRVGIARLAGSNAAPRLEFVLAARDPLHALPYWTNRIAARRDGGILAAGTVPLVEISAAGALRTFDAANGLCGHATSAVLEDDERNVWIGSDTCGLMKLARTGLVSFGPSSGVAEGAGTLVEDRAGTVCALAGVARWACRAGDGFVALAPRGIDALRYVGWASGQAALQDRDGAWWIAAGEALLRYPQATRALDLARLEPQRIGLAALGAPGGDVFRVFEDSRGRVWAGLSVGPERVLVAERGSTRFVPRRAVEGERLGPPSCFAEDRSGTVWVGFLDGTLRRVRDGRLARVDFGAGHDPGPLVALLADRTGRLWIATQSTGLWHVDDPAEAAPRVVRLGRADGLASDRVNALVEGADGRIYAGTIAGLDAIDPATSQVRHFGAADGLAGDFVLTALRDRAGALWFGTATGLSRLDPAAHAVTARSPAVFVTGLAVNGVRQPVAVRGESDVAGRAFGPGNTSVRIDVSGPSFAPGGALRFQHRVNAGAWSPAAPETGLTLAELAPGEYVVELRAVRPDGAASERPARVSFRVRPHFWRTGWFATLVALALGAAAWVVHRQRLARLLAVERVRTRIATDLHDDIGASLSRTAILAEVVRRDVGPAHPAAAERLDRIADSAREVVDGMADIVWSLDPAKDDFGELVRRVRAFAEDVLPPSGVAFTLEADARAAVLATRLGAEPRRHAYLVVKEALANVARHAGATAARVTLHLVPARTPALGRGRGWIEATIADDGHGFAPADGAARTFGGNGLRNMRARTEQMGGTLAVESESGRGTTIRLRLPFDDAGRGA